MLFETMRTVFKLLSVLLAIMTLAVSAEKKEKTPKLEWGDDFAAAQVQAKAENKKILLNFTGTDWCPWCIKLDKEVFSQPEFKDFASKNLVLVIVDFPHEKRLRSAVKKQNEALKATYGAQGYPTILVVDPEGKKVAQTGYIEGGAAKWTANLEGLLKGK